MSFNSVPKWKCIDPDADLYQIVNQMRNDNDWGSSTDFATAQDLMIEVCRTANVPKEEVCQMKMVVISDMQFDQARGNSRYYGLSTEWQDSATRIKNAWINAGYPDGYHPQMIYWNVRDTGNFVATSDTSNVQMMAGYNQEQLKVLLKA